MKFTANGQRVWGTYYGGSNFDQNPCCAVINQGYVFLSGNTGSPNNIATAGSFLPNINGFQKTFLAAFDLSGQRLWGTYYAGEFDDWSYGCTADTGNNVYIYGLTSSNTNIATPGSFQETMVGGGSGYLAKFNYYGIRLWGTYYGTGGTNVTEAAVDDSANIIIAGSAHDQNTIIPSQGAFQSVYRGGYYDSFLGKFNSGGQRFWGTYYGGTGQEGAMGLAVDHSDNIYLISNTVSENNSDHDSSLCTRSRLYNYIATPGAFLTEKPSMSAVFLVKFSDCYSPDTALQINGPVVVCANTAGVIYSIDPLYAATGYHWCVSGNLTITSGQNSTSVTVNVGPVVGTDTISVYGINSCDNGFPKSMIITVDLRPVPVITGPDTVCTGDTAVFYTSGGMINYLWSVSPGGNIVAKGTPADSTVSVIWTSGGVHWVKVNYLSGGCASLLPTQKTVWVNAGPAVSLTIAASANPVCTGTSVTFTATPINPGTSPAYQWKVNGINIGSNNPIYTYTPLNGDVITCILTSDELCASGNPALSNSISMVVYSVLPAGVSIGVSGNSVCAGTTVTFTATPVNGGSSPFYQWKVNAINAGINNPNYSYIPSNGDIVTCVMTSDLLCASGNPATSNSIMMIVNPNLPVSVAIASLSNPFCPGNSVTFTATPTNGGTAPFYQWKVNGFTAGANNPVYNYFPNNGDIVTCVMNPNIACPTGNPANSNIIMMIENTSSPVSVSINVSTNPVCSGSSVTFTAAPINGGVTPGFQWKVNGINAGTNNSIYSYVPVNGDVVKCILTSSLVCAAGNPATSNSIPMVVNPIMPVSIAINASANPVCAGTTVNFSATPTNGGTIPFYQWKVNGLNVGLNNSTYSYIPVNGDLVTCILTSNVTCPTGNPATSNTITMGVNQILTVGLSIVASNNPVCAGIPVTFTATPINGGPTPAYQWKVNGINSGTNNPIFTYTPVNGDIVTCILTSGLACLINNPATSNAITMNISALPVVTFILCFDSITAINAKPFKLKGGIPLNGTYSGPGVSANIFNPAAAGIGTKTIAYTYTNAALCSASKAKTLIVQAAPAFTCGNNLVDIRDGKSYPTVQIGTQCWMSSNLNSGITNSGMTNQRDNCIPEKYCLNDIPANCNLLGGLYQWDEMMQYDDTPAKQGICPPGWHVPTEAEWNTLFVYYT
ncbi:MAG: FISUMP domain-containing protein, partial [Bacteroidota bacterium]